eukprot:364991-Chlamydomonas_euryale.AAC.2
MGKSIHNVSAASSAAGASQIPSLRLMIGYLVSNAVVAAAALAMALSIRQARQGGCSSRLNKVEEHALHS